MQTFVHLDLTVLFFNKNDMYFFDMIHCVQWVFIDNVST